MISPLSFRGGVDQNEGTRAVLSVSLNTPATQCTHMLSMITVVVVAVEVVVAVVVMLLLLLLLIMMMKMMTMTMLATNM